MEVWNDHRDCGARPTDLINAFPIPPPIFAKPVLAAIFSCDRLLQLLRQMSKSGIQLSGWSFTLAMAACLESYRDRHVATGRKGPPEADLRLAQAVLSLFDRMVSIGEMPTGYTYALALKVHERRNRS